VARKSSPARLVIALSVAAVLAVFLLYTSLAGGGTPSVSPSELASKTGEVALAGKVVGTPTGDPHGAGMRFVVEDIDGSSKQRVTVLYKGSVPDMFRTGRDVVVTGTQQAGGTFVTKPGSMITKCPSKYQAADQPA
ncbi:cytochrome c maturation protein CcmE, partial [Gaiella sp.]|uniref:cytochrome c maturation protein CcmE domain-containing protein n=1 Tax=Gaiella sp. TaxID=2663207 RepID=UPI002E2FF5D1